MARGMKFRIEEEEGLYYPCSENKDADQLCGYRLFTHMLKVGFLITRLILNKCTLGHTSRTKSNYLHREKLVRCFLKLGSYAQFAPGCKFASVSYAPRVKCWPCERFFLRISTRVQICTICSYFRVRPPGGSTAIPRSICSVSKFIGALVMRKDLQCGMDGVSWSDRRRL